MAMFMVPADITIDFFLGGGIRAFRGSPRPNGAAPAALRGLLKSPPQLAGPARSALRATLFNPAPGLLKPKAGITFLECERAKHWPDATGTCRPGNPQGQCRAESKVLPTKRGPKCL